MIEQVPAAAANPTLGDAVLPRASECSSFGCAAHVFYRSDDFKSQFLIAVKDQILVGTVKRERFAQLLDDPVSCWMARDIEMQDAPPIMANDEETVENTERNRWNHEEIHRSNNFPMIPEECSPPIPSLRIFRCSLHPTRNGAFGNVESEHEKFTMNSWCAPSRVLGDHSENEIA